MDKIRDVTENKKIVSLQLGDKITNIHSIVKICKYGYPVAIQSLPFKKVKDELLPFPTTFWLTCPFLKREISRLESSGYISKARELLNNKNTLEDFTKARESTVKIRMSMTNKNFKYYSYLKNLGIGGSKNDLFIKCLHVHVANYFATKVNPIGKWVLEKISDTECRDCECCKLLNKTRGKDEK